MPKGRSLFELLHFSLVRYVRTFDVQNSYESTGKLFAVDNGKIRDNYETRAQKHFKNSINRNNPKRV